MDPWRGAMDVVECDGTSAVDYGSYPLEIQPHQVCIAAEEEFRQTVVNEVLTQIPGYVQHVCVAAEELRQKVVVEVLAKVPGYIQHELLQFKREFIGEIKGTIATCISQIQEEGLVANAMQHQVALPTFPTSGAAPMASDMTDLRSRLDGISDCLQSEIRNREEAIATLTQSMKHYAAEVGTSIGDSMAKSQHQSQSKVSSNEDSVIPELKGGLHTEWQSLLDLVQKLRKDSEFSEFCSPSFKQGLRSERSSKSTNSKVDDRGESNGVREAKQLPQNICGATRLLSHDLSRSNLGASGEPPPTVAGIRRSASMKLPIRVQSCEPTVVLSHPSRMSGSATRPLTPLRAPESTPAMMRGIGPGSATARRSSFIAHAQTPVTVPFYPRTSSPGQMPFVMQKLKTIPSSASPPL